MRSSRRTTPHVAENSVVDDATDACSLRGILAAFLADSSASLGRPFFYLIQSNGWKSLCLLTGLSVQDYSKLLLQSKLVRVRNNKDGSRSIRVDRDDWNTFLGRFELRGDIYGKGGCVELTDGRINYTAIERTMGGRIDHTTTNQKSAMMCVLRVGAVAPGETPPSNTAINREDDEPPRINKQMRQAKLNLAVDLTIKLRSFDEPRMEDLSAVSDWVLMINTTPAATKMTVGVKRKCAGDDPTNEPIPRTPPMQITPLSTSTTTTSTGDPNQFPALSSISPDALLRGKRVVNGVDLDLQLFQGMIHDSVKYCDMHNEPLQFQYSNGKHGVRLIKLPMSKGNDGRVTPNIKKCVDEMLSVVSEDVRDDANDIVVDLLLDYLLKSNKSKLMEKLRERKMVPRVMDEYDCAALLDESCIKIWQWRKIQQCLKLFMDIPKVGVAEKHLRALGVDHGEIKHGTYYYSDPSNPSKVKEEVRYWTKDPVYEFIQTLEGLINGYSRSPLEIDYIHIVHGGDHGKNKFRFASKVILCMKNGESYSQVFGLADVACRKDHAIILDNTCMPSLVEGINTIEECDILFSYASEDDDKDTNTLILNLTPTHRHVSTFYVKPTSFLAGDLAFLAVIMGKEDFSSSWCNWCKYSKAEWQVDCDVNINDMLWDINGINFQVDCNVARCFTDARIRGVRSSPKSLIPFSRIIFSGLHAGIGIGNRLIDHLEEFIDVDVENISHEEFQLRSSKESSENDIKHFRDLKQVWTKSPDGGRLLQKKRGRIKRLDVELNQSLDEASIAIKSAEKNSLNCDINTLIISRDEYTKQISRLDCILKDAKSKLDLFTKNRRGGEESLYTSVDRIFQKIGANRAHYFGRVFEGVDIRKIMAKSDDLFGVDGEIRLKLLEHVTTNSGKADKVHQTCSDICLALKLWDGAFSDIHMQNPSVEHCQSTQKRIDKAMAHIRSMGFSITPKMHGMEKHVVTQMQTIPGGIGKLMEHWIEQYHQIGHRFDMAYCRVGSLTGQAAIRSSVEKRGRNPRVQMNKQFLLEKFVGRNKKRSAAIANDEKKIHIKQERRNEALAEILVAIESKKIEAIRQKLKVQEDLDELDELADLETKLFGLIVA